MACNNQERQYLKAKSFAQLGLVKAKVALGVQAHQSITLFIRRLNYTSYNINDLSSNRPFVTRLHITPR